MTKLRHLIATLVAAGVATAALSACNTLEGVGQDVQKAGEKIEGLAKDDAKKKK